MHIIGDFESPGSYLDIFLGTSGMEHGSLGVKRDTLFK